jgi:predicted N-acyltransferase
MRPLSASDFEIQILNRVEAVAPEAWESLGGSLPFQSRQWYAFGEKVMADCPFFSIIVHQAGRPVARAAFWLVREEPLPLPGALRAILRPVLRRRPLLICRSPLANISGLILPAGPERAAVLERLLSNVLAVAREHACSFVLFDFVEAAELERPWPAGLRTASVAEPGTWMPFHWDSLEAYLADGNKDDRQHYKRSLRKAAELGICVQRRPNVSNLEQALALIRGVEARHGAAPSPWMKSLLEHLPEAGGTFLEAVIGNRLVGCGALFYDGEAQLATALGLAEDVPYVYFALVYASLEEACERRVRLLRWGSGAYEVKRRLGFRLETNNHAVFAGTRPTSALIARLAGEKLSCS